MNPYTQKNLLSTVCRPDNMKINFNQETMEIRNESKSES